MFELMLPVQRTFSVVSSIKTIAKITFIPERMSLFEFIFQLQRLKSYYAGMVSDGQNWKENPGYFAFAKWLLCEAA